MLEMRAQPVAFFVLRVKLCVRALRCMAPRCCCALENEALENACEDFVWCGEVNVRQSHAATTICRHQAGAEIGSVLRQRFLPGFAMGPGWSVRVESEVDGVTEFVEQRGQCSKQIYRSAHRRVVSLFAEAVGVPQDDLDLWNV